MTTAKDVKDMLGVAASDGPPKATLKKVAKIAGAKRLTGINREVLALHGDRAPPVVLQDASKTFKGKLKQNFKPSKWENVVFTNSARSDGLQLRHWRKQKLVKQSNAVASDTKAEIKGEPEYEFAKYNVSITVPAYSDEQYEAHLKSSDWSREETDYLLETVKEWNQKWPLVIDRYEYRSKSFADDIPSHNSTALVSALATEERTLEQLKARYYEVWSKTMALESGGVQNMNEQEFHLHETLTRYNPTSETARKTLAWALTNRSAEDIREEEYLLSELQRIMISQAKYEAERAEVRQRLEKAPPQDGGRTEALQTLNFATLNQLYNQLAVQDRNRKARHRLSLNSNDPIPSPAGVGPNGTPTTAQSLGSAGGPNRKGSMAAPQPVRQLTPRQEKRFGVTTHDRLNSGVTFRSDKLAKLRIAKSQILTQKIAAALVELGIPEVIPLPTQRVFDAFEQFIGKVQKLIETRKVVEKEEGELRVQGAMRAELKQPEEAGGDGQRDSEGDTTMNGADEEQDNDDDKDAENREEDEGSDGNVEAEDDAEDDADADADGDEDAEGEDDDAAADEMDVDVPVRPSSSRSNALGANRSRRRSASMLSMASSASKRSRKG